MFQDEVEKVELPAIEQLTRLGWTYVSGANLAPILPVDGAPVGERSYYRDVVLSKHLEATVVRLNPWISDENLRKVVQQFTRPTVRA
ncbi:MAG: hypothetical protein CMK32_05220 [Porticoccaceae bacterium]|nr:hypothetical protein [Porticoccaceae bacterium]